MKYTLMLLALLLTSLSLAEEQVQTMVFFEEPLVLTAVPDKQRHLLIVLPEPGITKSVYALKGMVRYENVEGEAYLQMNNNFGEKGVFFTKSVAASGPLGKIAGNSDWRPFTLPFFANSGDQSGGAQSFPEELTLALHLPGAGTVSVRDIHLYQYAAGEDPLQAEGQWISSRNAGLFGGIAGGVLGLWGALIGVLSSRGKARSFVLGSANVMLIIGVVSLIAAVAAFAAGQPYAIYYPLGLIGIIVAFVTGKLRSTLAARYEELELKRMQSMDA